jgi:hypothetical protein
LTLWRDEILFLKRFIFDENVLLVALKFAFNFAWIFKFLILNYFVFQSKTCQIWRK